MARVKQSMVKPVGVLILFMMIASDVVHAISLHRETMRLKDQIGQKAQARDEFFFDDAKAWIKENPSKAALGAVLGVATVIGAGTAVHRHMKNRRQSSAVQQTTKTGGLSTTKKLLLGAGVVTGVTAAGVYALRKKGTETHNESTSVLDRVKTFGKTHQKTLLLGGAAAAAGTALLYKKVSDAKKVEKQEDAELAAVEKEAKGEEMSVMDRLKANKGKVLLGATAAVGSGLLLKKAMDARKEVKAEEAETSAVAAETSGKKMSLMERMLANKGKIALGLAAIGATAGGGVLLKKKLEKNVEKAAETGQVDKGADVAEDKSEGEDAGIAGKLAAVVGGSAVLGGAVAMAKKFMGKKDETESATVEDVEQAESELVKEEAKEEVLADLDAGRAVGPVEFPTHGKYCHPFKDEDVKITDEPVDAVDEKCQQVKKCYADEAFSCDCHKEALNSIDEVKCEDDNCKENLEMLQIFLRHGECKCGEEWSHGFGECQASPAEKEEAKEEAKEAEVANEEQLKDDVQAAVKAEVEDKSEAEPEADKEKEKKEKE